MKRIGLRWVHEVKQKGKEIKERKDEDAEVHDGGGMYLQLERNH